MANILSQTEIDELLNVLASGQDRQVEEDVQEDEGVVKAYDFRIANKFSKDQIRTLHFIYDNFASRLSTYLSGTLRASCEVDVISIEEQSYSELSNSMPSQVIVSIISMPPLQGSTLLVLTPVIAYEIVSRLLGGAGQYEMTDKPFTEIEVSLIERVIRKMIMLINDAWGKVNEVKASLDRIETSGQYVQIVSANEPVAIITMNVKIGGVSDIINFCIPHVAVQPIAQNLVMRTWYSSIGTGVNTDKTNLESRLSGIQLSLQAFFNNTNASVGEVLGMRVGDVIQMEHRINEPITVKVEHIPKFRGAIGMQGSNYAVRVGDILREEIINEFTDAI